MYDASVQLDINKAMIIRPKMEKYIWTIFLRP